MKILKYLRLPVQFDVEKLKEETARIHQSGWMQHFQVKHYSGDWKAIPLRSLGGTNNINIALQRSDVYSDTEFLTPSSYFREVMDWFQCPLNAVRLLRLSAGSEILEHRDAEMHFEKGEVRIHIPVITHPGVEFYLDKERISLAEGECWYMNFNLPHSIRNHSPVDRIHLVIDAEVNDWLKEVFSHPGLHKKETEEFDENTRLQIIASLRALNTETAHKLADEMESNLTSNI